MTPFVLFLLLLYLITGLPGLFEVLAQETPSDPLLKEETSSDDDPLRLFSHTLFAVVLGASLLFLLYILVKGTDGSQLPEIPPFDPETEGPWMRVKKAAEIVRRHHRD